MLLFITFIWRRSVEDIKNTPNLMFIYRNFNIFSMELLWKKYLFIIISKWLCVSSFIYSPFLNRFENGELYDNCIKFTYYICNSLKQNYWCISFKVLWLTCSTLGCSRKTTTNSCHRQTGWDWLTLTELCSLPVRLPNWRYRTAANLTEWDSSMALFIHSALFTLVRI